MSRAAWYFVLAGTVTAIAVAAAAFYLSRYPGNHEVVFVVALAFFIPGRISSFYLKDLYRSRRHLSAEQFDAAIECGRRFLQTLSEEPWRRRLVYLTWSAYSWNVAAMARNNIGAALMMLGRFDAARWEFQAALADDPRYALPYANLAVMAEVDGDHAAGARLMAEAHRYGYSGRSADKLLDKVAAAYARVQAGG